MPRPELPAGLAARYPHIARFVTDYGRIEVGYDEYLPTFIKALDMGGLIWRGEPEYATLDDAFAALDAGIAAWFAEQGE